MHMYVCVDVCGYVATCVYCVQLCGCHGDVAP